MIPLFQARLYSPSLMPHAFSVSIQYRAARCFNERHSLAGIQRAELAEVLPFLSGGEGFPLG